MFNERPFGSLFPHLGISHAEPHLPNAGHRALANPVATHFKALQLCSRAMVHEAGHAVVAWHSHCINGISRIICRTDDGETTINHPHRHFASPHILWDLIAIDLAGIAAEAAVFVRVNSYRSRMDLTEAKKSAGVIASCPQGQPVSCPWADEPKLGTLDIDSMFKEGCRPDATGGRILKMCYRRAKALLVCDVDGFARLILELGNRNELTGEEIAALLGPRFQ